MTKRIIKRTLLILIIILLALPFLLQANDNVEWRKLPFYTWGYIKKGVVQSGRAPQDWQAANNTNEGAVINSSEDIKYSDVDYVFVNMKGSASVSGANRGAYGHTLRQYNVFCAEKLENTVYGWYKVSDEREVDNKTLAYILYNGSNIENYSYDNTEDEGNMGYRTSPQKQFWKYLYNNPDIIPEINKSEIGPSLGKTPETDPDFEEYKNAENYANDVANFNPNVSIEDNSDGKLKITVIGCDDSKPYIDYTLSYKVNNGANIEINTADKIEETENGIKKHIYYIDKQENGTVEANLNVMFTEYFVKYVVLTSGTSQTILVVTEIGTKIHEYNSEATIKVDADVSMQKYITKVNKGGNTDNIIELNSERENKRTSEQENSIGHINEEGKYKDVSTNNKVDESYKIAGPVEIENGDSVTYRLYVYNNKNYKARGITLIDRLPYYYRSKEDTTFENKDNKDLAVDTENIIVKDKDGNDVTDNKLLTQNENTGTYELKINDISLDANQSTYYDITLTFNKDLSGIQTNTAWIECEENETEYRTVDRDYVKMPDTDISMQKYITKVNKGGNTDNIIELNNERENKRTSEQENAIGHIDEEGKYNDISTNNKEDESYKIASPVRIEVGDSVTYRLYVYNNKNNKVEEIVLTDRLPYYYKSKEDTTFENKDNKETSIDIQNIIIKDKDGNDVTDNKSLKQNENNGTYELKISNISLDANQSTYYDITLTFNKYLNEIQTNTAWVTCENNKTEYRTVDRDYIKMADINVSLQKYITQVNGEDVNSRENRKATENTTNEIWKDITTSNITNSTGTNKYNDVVKIELGDIVTYRIYVYNNSNVKATSIKVTDTLPGYAKEYSLDGGNTWISVQANNNFTYTIENLVGGTSAYFDVKVRFNEFSANILINTAKITETIPNNDTEYRIEDADYVKMQPYYVSLEKYVSKINNEELKDINANVKERAGKPEHNNDDKTDTNNNWKYNNVVTVSQNDEVTYTIIVRNDSPDTSVRVSKVIDILPQGVEYVKATGDYQKTDETDKLAFIAVNDELITTGGSRTFEVTVKVTESNMSVNILKNTASIDEESLSNRNNISIRDLTQNNNTDSDYIQMKDIVISGTVWNDKALNKLQDNYNGIFDENEENKLSNITVKLYRQGEEGVLSSTTTDANGNYTFALNYIKGPKQTTNNRWNGKYYSYYVVFEYDGITYTSTEFADLTLDNSKDSNAREKLDNSSFDGIVEKDRTAFNNNFNTINNSTNIAYTTKNENGYIPQSNHVYNPETMAMQASTTLIDLSSAEALEEKLQHVNLGLRGRDIFDLELTSDVDNIKVTINNQVGVYKYSNKVTLRRKVLNNITEDMANIESEKSNTYVDSQEQNIRRTDFDINSSGANVKNYKKEQAISNIQVTYKITVQNTSRTSGTATKITNYYDSRYDFVGAYETLEDASNLIKELNLDNNLSKEPSNNDKYGYKTIITPDKMLKQAERMEVYVVYTLKTPVTDTLAGLTKDNPIPTYNMAEITEYKTACAEGQTEYTRGLIDKDSAPYSVNKEQVRTTENEGQNIPTTNGKPTTLSYYFGGNDLSKFKYEDDTYATPTLYFVIPYNDNGTLDNPDDDDYYNRTITGVVFEDKTSTNLTTKIKTGNGKLDEGESPVYGATVELIEKVGDGETRYRTTTREDGKFEFSGFLPGEYFIKYSYGDTTNTVLLNQAKKGTNNQSYNGEDYQSTNNTGNHGAYKLNSTNNFWYVYNETEGVSVATDIASRRNSVSNNVTKFTDEEMQVLNNIRSGRNANDSKVTYRKNGNQQTITVDNIIDKTNMQANSKEMLLTVEETINLNNLGENKAALLEQNQITIKEEDSNIGEWNRFPNINDLYYKKYEASNMNFGIAVVPVTQIDMQKHVKEFTITDSTGSNVIASMKYEDGRWKLKGDVIITDSNIDVSIEDDKLQGARLEITYEITVNMQTEKNFDNKSLTVPTIKGIVDYINNNLSYNAALGDNAKYWELTTYDEIKQVYAAQQWEDGTIPQGTIDSEGKQYTTIVKAKGNNPLLLTTEGTGAATITLEKVLSSTDSTIEEIITSTVDSFEYSNIVEITGLDYGNVTPTDPIPPIPPTDPIPQRDRIRTPDRYIIVPGVHHDAETSETIVIHPPTGDSSINIVYYVIAVISLVILAAGVFGIKKFVVNTKK